MTIAFFCLMSCSVPLNLSENKEAKLTGSWTTTTVTIPEFKDGFEIKQEGDDLMFYYYNNAEKSIGYAGRIVNNPDLSEKSGYIIIQITNSGTWYKTMDYYYTLHWKDFTGDNVKQSSAYNGGKPENNNGMATEHAARKEYTVDNGYFASHGIYARD